MHRFWQWGRTMRACGCGMWRTRARCFQRPKKRRKKSSVAVPAYGPCREMQAVFTLASGRSGTHFLYELIRRNAVDCVARHETYGFNPSMFGRPIYDHAIGERAYTHKLLPRKKRIIDRCGASTYVETSHAFLKSWFDLAPEYFP